MSFKKEKAGITRPSPCSSRETFGRAGRSGVVGRLGVSAADRIDANEATPAGWNSSVRYRPDVPRPERCEGHCTTTNRGLQRRVFSHLVPNTTSRIIARMARCLTVSNCGPDTPMTIYSGTILPGGLDRSEQRWAPTRQFLAGRMGGQSRLGSTCMPSTGILLPKHLGRFHEGVPTSPGCFMSGSKVLIGAGGDIVCAKQIAAIAVALRAAPHISIIRRIAHPPKVGPDTVVPQSNYGQLNPGAWYRRHS